MSRRALVVAAAMLAVTLASATPAAAAKAVPVKEWSGSVCTRFSKWDARLAKLASVKPPADPSAGKAAITKYLSGALRATNTLAKGLKSAGVPAIKDGKAIAAALAGAVESLRAAYTSAKAAAAALPTTDPVSFGTAAQSLAVQLQTAETTMGSTLATTAEQHPASALVEAFRSTKACRPFV